MDWDVLKAGLDDELEKISISLMGFSPESVLNRPEPQPMQTAGLAKALKILGMTESVDLTNDKTASARTAKYVSKELAEYALRREIERRRGKTKLSWRKVVEETDNKYERVRPWVNRGLAGAGAGTLLAGLTAQTPSLNRRLMGAAVGAGASLADHAYARHRRHVKNLRSGMIKQSRLSLPGPLGALSGGAKPLKSLHISRNIGLGVKTSKGLGIKSQIPHIGRIR